MFNIEKEVFGQRGAGGGLSNNAASLALDLSVKPVRQQNLFFNVKLFLTIWTSDIF